MRRIGVQGKAQGAGQDAAGQDAAGRAGRSNVFVVGKQDVAAKGDTVPLAMT